MNVDPLIKQEEKKMKTCNALHWIAFKFLLFFRIMKKYFYLFSIKKEFACIVLYLKFLKKVSTQMNMLIFKKLFFGIVLHFLKNLMKKKSLINLSNTSIKIF